MVCVPIRGVTPVSLFEGLCHPHRSMRDRNQMHVVGHQTVTQQRKTMQLRILPQRSELGHAVAIVVENHLSSVAALGNMVRNVNHDDAREPSHRRSLAETGPGSTASHTFLSQ